MISIRIYAFISFISELIRFEMPIEYKIYVS